MDNIKKIETQIENWLKPIPHLPEKWRKWMSENIWWIAAIGAVLLVLSLLAMVGALLVALGLTSAMTSFAWYGWGAVYGSSNIFMLIVTLALVAGYTIIYITAINPLKNGERRGWDLMFLAFLLGVLNSVVSLFSSYSGFFTGLVNAAIGAFIGAYLLFEIKSYFVKSSSK